VDRAAITGDFAEYLAAHDHGRWLAGNVAGARVRLLSGEGHLTLGITRFDEVLAELR
jgi:hypothetical protein